MRKLWKQGELGELAENDGPPSLLRCYAEAFRSVVTSPDFPCTFTWLPFATDSIRYDLVCLEEDGYEEFVIEALEGLVEQSRSNIDTTLVIFLPQQAEVNDESEVSLHDDFAIARSIVHSIISLGDEASADATLPNWSLRIGGTEIFVNFSSPRHHLRRSRNVGACLTLIAQTRASFEVKGRGRQSVRDHIRSRIGRYDEIPPHPALGTHGQPGNREAHQYFLGDGLTNLDPTT